jgi:hypothetical protein
MSCEYTDNRGDLINSIMHGFPNGRGRGTFLWESRHRPNFRLPTKRRPSSHLAQSRIRKRRDPARSLRTRGPRPVPLSIILLAVGRARATGMDVSVAERPRVLDDDRILLR